MGELPLGLAPGHHRERPPQDVCRPCGPLPSFDADAALAPGPNQVVITATDVAGRVVRSSLQIRRDTVTPLGNVLVATRSWQAPDVRLAWGGVALEVRRDQAKTFASSAALALVPAGQGHVDPGAVDPAAGNVLFYRVDDVACD